MSHFFPMGTSKAVAFGSFYLFFSTLACGAANPLPQSSMAASPSPPAATPKDESAFHIESVAGLTFIVRNKVACLVPANVSGSSKEHAKVHGKVGVTPYVQAEAGHEEGNEKTYSSALDERSRLADTLRYTVCEAFQNGAFATDDYRKLTEQITTRGTQGAIDSNQTQALQTSLADERTANTNLLRHVVALSDTIVKLVSLKPYEVKAKQDLTKQATEQSAQVQETATIAIKATEATDQVLLRTLSGSSEGKSTTAATSIAPPPPTGAPSTEPPPTPPPENVIAPKP